MPPHKQRYITPEDLYEINLILDSQISPDGSQIVYCVQQAVRKKEKKFANLWMIPTTGGSPHLFTSGDQSDTHPRWSPQGTHIAFLSNRNDENQSQLYIIPVRGGEARKLTDVKGTFEDFTWSPDGTQIAFIFRKKDEEDIEREKDSEKKDLGIISRHITRVFYKEDGQGYLPRERKHLWVVTVDTGELNQITEGDIHDETQPSWSPDGKKIVFCSNRSTDPDLDPDAIDLFVIPAEGGDFKKIELFVGPKSLPQYSPDGKWIAFYGHEGKHVNWKLTRLWIVPADGSDKARNLTEDWDINVNGFTINDLPGTLPGIPPQWSPDSKRVYFQVSHHGNTTLQSVSVHKKRLESVIDESGVLGACTFDETHTHVAYLFGTMNDPGNVWMFDLEEKTSRKLTQVNEEFFTEVVLGECEEVWFTGPDENDLQGWILTPPDFDESMKYPSILEIHGGPRTQYGNLFMHEFHVLAAEGYVVYFCNPRGSKGYGEEHSKAILNRWGTVDYADIMSWVDTVEQLPYIDSKRMGVTGGSYGGYMTNWIIGHTDRFAAAVTQRSVSNLTSMYGSSDFNWAFEEEFGRESPWENIENYWEQSPLKYIGNCTTPTLVIHSEQDLRCDKEQGVQIFVALKRMGIDTELILFPEEFHGLSRGGRTDRRISRLQHMIRWFNTYLQ